LAKLVIKEMEVFYMARFNTEHRIKLAAAHLDRAKLRVDMAIFKEELQKKSIENQEKHI